MQRDWLNLLHSVTALAQAAGQTILRYCGASADLLQISHKPDNTLLTDADRSAHEFIVAGLEQLAPEIPILSEEGAIPPLEERAAWSRYWLLDPLDGTRGFVAGRLEFTVNIALMDEGVPVLGVVDVPALSQTYSGAEGHGAWRYTPDEGRVALQAQPIDWSHFQVLLGHYLNSNELVDFFAQDPGCQVLRVNSSLKFCQIASGFGDLYPRFGPISEWDTAAAHCILKEAGGDVVDLNGETLQYNARDSLIHPPFVAMGDLSEKENILALIHKIQEEKTT